jgi:hypothetical protein
MPSRLAQLVPRDSRREPREKLLHGVRERQKSARTPWVVHDLDE